MNPQESSRPALSPAQFARVRSLFDRAMELPSSERALFIEVEARDDQAVRTAASELLEAEESEESPFDPEGGGVAREALSLDTPVATTVSGMIGPFKIERLIGEGGMGQVWRARRADGLYEAQAAIKLLRADLGSDELQRRFERERKLLLYFPAGAAGPGLHIYWRCGTARAQVPFHPAATARPLEGGSEQPQDS